MFIIVVIVIIIIIIIISGTLSASVSAGSGPMAHGDQSLLWRHTAPSLRGLTLSFVVSHHPTLHLQSEVSPSLLWSSVTPHCTTSQRSLPLYCGLSSPHTTPPVRGLSLSIVVLHHPTLHHQSEVSPSLLWSFVTPHYTSSQRSLPLYCGPPSPHTTPPVRGLSLSIVVFRHPTLHLQSEVSPSLLWSFVTPHYTSSQRSLPLYCGLSSPHTTPPVRGLSLSIVVFRHPTLHLQSEVSPSLLWSFVTPHCTSSQRSLPLYCGLSSPHTAPPVRGLSLSIALHLQSEVSPSLLWSSVTPHYTSSQRSLPLYCEPPSPHTTPPVRGLSISIVVLRHPTLHHQSEVPPSLLWSSVTPHYTTSQRSLPLYCGLSSPHNQSEVSPSLLWSFVTLHCTTSEGSVPLFCASANRSPWPSLVCTVLLKSACPSYLKYFFFIF